MLEDGYAAATIPAIADEAGVSAQTVYAAFGSKAGLYKRIVDIGIVGDEELIPVSGRSIVEDVRSARSAAARLRLFAEYVAGVQERLSDIVEIGLAAAGSDAEIADLVRRMDQQRRIGMREFVDFMADLGSLHKDLDLDEATDIVWVLTAAATYRLLVAERGWSRDAYTRWLALMLETSIGPRARRG
jgi:AcrR family transcriptional regulator